MEIGLPIELGVWQITSEYAIIEQYDDKIIINFKFWDEKQKEVRNKIGRLRFSGVWTLRYSKYNKTRFYLNEIEHSFRSYYLEIKDSNWLKSIENDRRSFDDEWEKYNQKEFKHYVFQNNSYFIEIIAIGVEFKIEKNIERYNKIWKGK
jgi:hypothetical protein